MGSPSIRSRELRGWRTATTALLLLAALGTHGTHGTHTGLFVPATFARSITGPWGHLTGAVGTAPVRSRARLAGSTGRRAPSPMGRRRASAFPGRRPPDGGGGPVTQELR